MAKDSSALPKSILVVEDDVVQQRLLEMTLDAEGYEVHRASNGLEAKEIVTSTEIGMIILDLVMPEMDGVRFLEWLRREAERDVPVLVLSSYEDKVRDVLGTLGRTGFQRKPVDFDELLEEIEETLGPPDEAPEDTSDEASD